MNMVFRSIIGGKIYSLTVGKDGLTFMEVLAGYTIEISKRMESDFYYLC